MKQTFGSFLKEKRTERMLKLNTFARLIGISPVYASYLENGKRPAPSRRILDLVIEKLQLNQNDAEKLLMLAAETHNLFAIPSDIAEYIYQNPYAIDALRTAKEHNLPNSTWLEFIDQIENSFK